MPKYPPLSPSKNPDSRVSKMRAVLVMVLAFGSGALEQGCVHPDKKPDYKPLSGTVDRARLAGEEGKFLEALQLYARADIKKLTEADQQNIETFQDGLEEQIRLNLKRGRELVASAKDAENNYPEAVAELTLALSKMAEDDPDYEKVKKELYQLEEKINLLTEEYFELSYNKLADLYLDNDYVGLAQSLQRMHDIVLSLNRDPRLFKKENFLEICWQIGEQYFKMKRYKEALIIFKLSERFLLPGQAIPQEYKDLISAAEYWHKKDWKEKSKKIEALEKEARNTDRKRLREIRQELEVLKKGRVTKDQQGKLTGLVATVIEDVENPYPKEVKNPKRRRRWHRRRVAKIEEKPVSELVAPKKPEPMVDISQKLEKVSTLLDEGNEKEAMDELLIIHRKYKKELIKQKRETAFVMKRLSEQAEKAYVNQQPKKAIRYYRAVLLLDPSNARAKKQVEILEGLVQEANGM